MVVVNQALCDYILQKTPLL